MRCFRPTSVRHQSVAASRLAITRHAVRDGNLAGLMNWARIARLEAGFGAEDLTTAALEAAPLEATPLEAAPLEATLSPPGGPLAVRAGGFLAGFVLSSLIITL